jgi:hypothetical protein
MTTVSNASMIGFYAIIESSNVFGPASEMEKHRLGLLAWNRAEPDGEYTGR